MHSSERSIVILSVQWKHLPGGRTEESSHALGSGKNFFIFFPSLISRSQHRTSQQRSAAKTTSLFVPDRTLRNALCVCERAWKREERSADVKTVTGVKRTSERTVSWRKGEAKRSTATYVKTFILRLYNKIQFASFLCFDNRRQEKRGGGCMDRKWTQQQSGTSQSEESCSGQTHTLIADSLIQTILLKRELWEGWAMDTHTLTHTLHLAWVIISLRFIQ